MTALPCPQCKHGDVKTEPDAAGYEYQTYCHNCYDADCVGDPPRFVSNSLMGHGRSHDESIASWNEEVEMYEPTIPLAGRQP